MLETALPRQNYQKFVLYGRCNTKLNYLRLIAINNCTVQSLLLNKNKWNLKVSISVLLFFSLPNYGFGNMLSSPFYILKCYLNLSSEQRKVSSDFLEKIKYESFWSKHFSLLGIKSVYGWLNSPSWYTDSWFYTIPPRVEPHCQLLLFLVHWSYRERNTHAMLYKCKGVRRLKHGKSRLQIRWNRSLL